MTRDVNVDQILDGWFTEGPTRLPDRTVAAIAERLDDVHQRGPLGLPGRSSMPRFLPALTGAAIVLVVGVMFLGVYVNGTGIGVKPSPTPSASPTDGASGEMWPQSTLDEVRAAQERADAGDPEYTWQVDPRLFIDDSWAGEEPGHTVFVGRFLREVLGWEPVIDLRDGLSRTIAFHRSALTAEPA